VSKENPIWRRILEVHNGMSNNDARHYAIVLCQCRRDIINRCTNPECEAYPDYGGRGIDVCSEWADTINGADVFADWALSNGWKPGLEIDRVDNDFGYSPENCRWTTRVANSLNRRSNVSYSIELPSTILRRLTGLNGTKFRKLKSIDEIQDAIIHRRELEVKRRNEYKSRLKSGKCPLCGNNSTIIYRRREHNGNMVPVGCPSCVSEIDTYAAAVEAGLL